MEEILTSIGLSEEEVEVYLSLLERGAQSASQLDKNTNVKRTYIYRIAAQLRDKGLVTEKKEGRTTKFEPNSPDHLVSLAEAKKIEAQQAQSSLEGILSSLKGKYVSVEDKPLVNVYEGINGIKKIYKDTLNEGKNIRALLKLSEPRDELKSWIRNFYVPERVKKGIHAKVFLAADKLSDEYVARNKTSNRTVKLIDPKRYPIDHKINIYGNKVAFMKVKKDGVPMGFVVEHPQVANALSSWFELTWDNTKNPS